MGEITGAWASSLGAIGHCTVKPPCGLPHALPPCSTLPLPISHMCPPPHRHTFGANPLPLSYGGALLENRAHELLHALGTVDEPGAGTPSPPRGAPFSLPLQGPPHSSPTSQDTRGGDKCHLMATKQCLRAAAGGGGGLMGSWGWEEGRPPEPRSGRGCPAPVLSKHDLGPALMHGRTQAPAASTTPPGTSPAPTGRRCGGGGVGGWGGTPLPWTRPPPS
jgi:hypothetical protein